MSTGAIQGFLQPWFYMSFLTQVGPCDTISVTAYYAAHLCHHHNSVIPAHFKALGTRAPKRTHVSFFVLTVVKLYSGAKTFSS